MVVDFNFDFDSSDEIRMSLFDNENTLVSKLVYEEYSQDLFYDLFNEYSETVPLINSLNTNDFIYVRSLESYDRNKGYAKVLLNLLTATNNCDIVLCCEPFNNSDLTKKELIKYYERLGFDIIKHTPNLDFEVFMIYTNKEKIN